MSTQTITRKAGTIGYVTPHYLICECDTETELGTTRYVGCAGCGAQFTLPDRHLCTDIEIEADPDTRDNTVAPWELRVGDRFHLDPYGRCQVVHMPEVSGIVRVLVKIAGGEITELHLRDAEWLHLSR